MHLFTCSCRCWLLVGLLATPLLFTHQMARGQTEPYYQNAPADSGRGYWQVKTDYTSRMTRVSFYTAQHELLYQEKIIDRYVKLTKRTIHQFDELLAKLVDQHLITDHVKSYELVASNQRIVAAQPSRFMEKPERITPAIKSPDTTTPTADLKAVSSSQLKLAFRNPANEKLLLTISDESSMFVYKEFTTLESYTGLFNLSQLASGTYRFEVDAPKKLMHYQLQLDHDKKSLIVKTLPTRMRR